jgi:3D (Asp-Asp-Asp) domain-containing protein
MLLNILKQQFTWAKVLPHRNWWSSCPGKNFDKNRIIESFLPLKVNSPDWSLMLEKKNPLLWTYNMTRYYSPIQWQDHYYKWKTYAQDVTTNCWSSAIWNNGCLTPAYWWILTNEETWRVVACWSQFPPYTKFNIKWYWWVTCKDRGSSIIGKDLDLWVWFWNTGLNTIENTVRPAWSVEVTEVLFPDKQK